MDGPIKRQRETLFMTGGACAAAWVKQAVEAEARHKYSIPQVILGLLAGLGLCNPCFAGSNSPQCQFGSHGNSLLTQAQCCKPKQCAFTASCKWSDGSVRAEHVVHHESCNESDSTQSMESSLGLSPCRVAVLKATGDDPPRCGAPDYPRSRSLHYLVVPTEEVKGIEEYQKVKSMHLWELAERFWDARLGKDKQPETKPDGSRNKLCARWRSNSRSTSYSCYLYQIVGICPNRGAQGKRNRC